MRIPRLLAAIAAVGAVTAATFAVAPPAAAAAPAISFVKNYADVTNGKLTHSDGLGNARTWRAGSGQSMDDCASGIGWLPNGTYSVYGTYWNYPGTTVQGPAVYISNKACSNGSTIRTELFVHSSYPWSSNRYYSNGCIKLSSTGTPAAAGGDIYAFVSRQKSYPATTVVVR